MAKNLSKKQLKNVEYFETHLSEFLENELYKNKFLIIHNREIKGIFDSFESALTNALSNNFPMDEFIIQQVIDENEIVSFIRMAA